MEPAFLNGPYLIRSKKRIGRAVPHYWDGKDTLCRMFSTGGLRKEIYVLTPHANKEICLMCRNNAKKVIGVYQT